MNTVDEIKLASLKRELAVGIEDLIHGRFQTYNDAKQNWPTKFAKVEESGSTPCA